MPVSKFASKIMVLGKGNNQFAVTRKERAVTTPDTPIHVRLLLGHLLSVPLGAGDFSLDLCHDGVYVSPHKSQILVNLCLVLNIYHR